MDFISQGTRVTEMNLHPVGSKLWQASPTTADESEDSADQFAICKLPQTHAGGANGTAQGRHRSLFMNTKS